MSDGSSLGIVFEGFRRVYPEPPPRDEVAARLYNLFCYYRDLRRPSKAYRYTEEQAYTLALGELLRK